MATEYKDQTVLITDLVTPDKPVLEDLRFERALVRGPAVLALTDSSVRHTRPRRRSGRHHLGGP
jgi:hypothetical protein